MKVKGPDASSGLSVPVTLSHASLAATTLCSIRASVPPAAKPSECGKVLEEAEQCWTLAVLAGEGFLYLPFSAPPKGPEATSLLWAWEHSFLLQGRHLTSRRRSCVCCIPRGTPPVACDLGNHNHPPLLQALAPQDRLQVQRYAQQLLHLAEILSLTA